MPNDDFNSTDYLPSDDDIGSFLSQVSQQVDGLDHDPTRGAQQPSQESDMGSADYGKSVSRKQRSPATGSRVTAGEWKFLINGHNKTITIVEGEGTGTVFRPGTPGYARVVRNLLAYGGAIAKAVRKELPSADQVAGQATPETPSAPDNVPDTFEPPPFYARPDFQRNAVVVGSTVVALGALYYFGVFGKIADFLDRD